MPLDHARRLDLLARACALGPEQIHALLWRSGFSADCDRGRHGSAAQVRTRIRAILGFAGSDDDIDDAWCGAFGPDPAVIDVLDRHRGDRVLALFTNNGPLEEQALTPPTPRCLRPVRPPVLQLPSPLPQAGPGRLRRGGRLARGGRRGDRLHRRQPGERGRGRWRGWHCFQYRDAAQLRRALTPDPDRNQRRSSSNQADGAQVGRGQVEDARGGRRCRGPAPRSTVMRPGWWCRPSPAGRPAVAPRPRRGCWPGP